MDEKKIALLIDVENTSKNYLDTIIAEIKKYGDVTIKRMYGDFSSGRLSDWQKKGMEYAIVPIHQPIYTSGKNAADIMLVIDAMDILYSGNVDGFCIVSSDSDFTRLVTKLREAGKFVIGMGKTQASRFFVQTCNEYKFLDRIEDDSNDSTEDDAESSITPLKDIKQQINVLLQEAENKNEKAYLGSLKSQLQRSFPDFDERNYGYSKFTKFIEEKTKFHINQDGSSAYISREERKEDADNIAKVNKYILEQLAAGIDLAKIGKGLSQKYKHFSYKDLGYSKLSKYVDSIQEK